MVHLHVNLLLGRYRYCWEETVGAVNNGNVVRHKKWVYIKGYP